MVERIIPARERNPAATCTWGTTETLAARVPDKRIYLGSGSKCEDVR